MLNDPYSLQCLSEFDENAFFDFQERLSRNLTNTVTIDVVSSEMTLKQRQFVAQIIRNQRPKKVLEIGVSSGGTTMLLLAELSQDAVLHSVDISEISPRDATKQVGHVAVDFFENMQMTERPTWKRHFGKDIADCMEAIGKGVDLVLLDTVHSLPGEFLSFLVFLPYLHDKSVLILHDIALHSKRVLHNPITSLKDKAYSNLLLFSGIFSPRKLYLPREQGNISNIGAMIIDKETVLANIDVTLSMLGLPWRYYPADILKKTRAFVKKNYNSDTLHFYDQVCEYNRLLLIEKKKRKR